MKVELAPSLNRFVAEKLKSGDYQDASEVIRESLRRWKEREATVSSEPAWLEQKVQEGADSADCLPGGDFWGDLKKELHHEHKR